MRHTRAAGCIPGGSIPLGSAKPVRPMRGARDWLAPRSSAVGVQQGRCHAPHAHVARGGAGGPSRWKGGWAPQRMRRPTQVGWRDATSHGAVSNGQRAQALCSREVAAPCAVRQGVSAAFESCGGWGGPRKRYLLGLWVPGRRRDRSSTRKRPNVQSSWGGSEGGGGAPPMHEAQHGGPRHGHANEPSKEASAFCFLLAELRQPRERGCWRRGNLR